MMSIFQACCDSPHAKLRKGSEWATLLIEGGYFDSSYVRLIGVPYVLLIGVHQLLEGITGLMFSNITVKISVLYFYHRWSRRRLCFIAHGGLSALLESRTRGPNSSSFVMLLGSKSSRGTLRTEANRGRGEERRWTSLESES